MITFKTIQAQNFLSIGFTPVIFDLSSTENTIIYGINGAGKSTIIDMICYVLFNKVIRDVKLNQLISSINKKKMLVEVEFSSNGTEYKVQRGQKPAVFKIFKNSEQINQEAATKDLQQMLEQIIGTDFKTFTQTSVMSSTSSEPFMELSTPDRRLVVEKMLDLEVIGKMSATMKERQKEVKFNLDQQLSKIDSLTNKVESSQAIVDNIQEVSYDQLLQLTQDIKKQEIKLKESKDKLTDKNNYEVVYPDKPKIHEKSPNIELELPPKPKVKTSPELPTEPIMPSLELPDQPEEPDTVLIKKLETKIAELESVMNICVSKANELKETAGFYQHNENCDRCKQHITTDFKKTIIDDINNRTTQLRTEYTENKTVKSEKESQLSHELDREINYNKYLDLVIKTQTDRNIICAKIRDKYKAECSQIIATHEIQQQMQISEWNNKCNQLTTYINNKNKEILDNYENEVQTIMAPYIKEKSRIDLELSNELATLRAEYSTNNTHYQELSEKLKLLESKQDNKLEEYKSKLSEYKNNLNIELKQKVILTEKKELCELGTEMLKDTGLKAKIVRQYLPSINSSINKYLDRMQANYSFVLDENFNETIKSRHRDIFSYGSFSNGERSRINVAILLMWIDLAKSKNTVSSNILMIDEVLDGALDAEGISFIMSILDEMKQVNTFVISHRKEIRHLFDANIEVQKVGNFSKYKLIE